MYARADYRRGGEGRTLAPQRVCEQRHAHMVQEILCPPLQTCLSLLAIRISLAAFPLMAFQVPATHRLGFRGVGPRRHEGRMSRVTESVFHFIFFFFGLLIYSRLSFPLPLSLSLCRLCTAAADRKLRLLTSDLQEQHEVKVAQHLEDIGQNFSCHYAHSTLNATWLNRTCSQCGKAEFIRKH